MTKWLTAWVILLALAILAFAGSWGMAQETKASNEAKAEPPILGIALEVFTAQGQPRAFERPGLPPTYWNPSYPVVQGDRVQIQAFIDPKKEKLNTVRVRLDNAVLSDKVEGSWVSNVDTANLTLGHHLIEVFAETKSPGNHFKSVTTTFLVVPQNDPLLQVLLPEYNEASQAKLPQGSDPKLANTIGSANPEVDRALKETGPVVIDERTLLDIQAKAPAKVYVYTLSRNGRITYISPSIDLSTYLELVPKRLDASGLAEGEVVLTVWAGSGADRFGPPTRIVLYIK